MNKNYKMLRDRLFGRLMEKRAMLNLETIMEMPLERLQTEMPELSRRLNMNAEAISALEDKIKALEAAPESPIQPKGPVIENRKQALERFRKEREGLSEVMENAQFRFHQLTGSNWTEFVDTKPTPLKVQVGPLGAPKKEEDLSGPRGTVKPRPPRKPNIMGTLYTKTQLKAMIEKLEATKALATSKGDTKNVEKADKLIVQLKGKLTEVESGQVSNRKELAQKLLPADESTAPADGTALTQDIFLKLLTSLHNDAKGKEYQAFLHSMIRYLAAATGSRMGGGESPEMPDFLPRTGFLYLSLDNGGHLAHLKGTKANQFVGKVLDTAADKLAQQIELFNTMLQDRGSLLKHKTTTVPLSLDEQHNPDASQFTIQKDQGNGAFTPVPKFKVEKEKGKPISSKMLPPDEAPETTALVERIQDAQDRAFQSIYDGIYNRIIKNIPDLVLTRDEAKREGRGRAGSDETNDPSIVERNEVKRRLNKEKSRELELALKGKKGPFAGEDFNPLFQGSMSVPGKTIKQPEMEEVGQFAKEEDGTARKLKSREDKKPNINYKDKKVEKMPLPPRKKSSLEAVLLKLAIRSRKRHNKVEQDRPILEEPKARSNPHRAEEVSTPSSAVLKMMQKEKDRLRNLDKGVSIEEMPAALPRGFVDVLSPTKSLPPEVEMLRQQWKAFQEKAEQLQPAAIAEKIRNGYIKPGSPAYEEYNLYWKQALKFQRAYESISVSIEDRNAKLMPDLDKAKKIVAKLERAEDEENLKVFRPILARLEQETGHLQELMSMAIKGHRELRRKQDTSGGKKESLPYVKKLSPTMTQHLGVEEDFDEG